MPCTALHALYLQYTVGKEAPRALVDSLMYKLSYSGLGRVTNGFDFARNTEIGQKEIVLKYFEEAYTTENWLVRIYKVSSYHAGGST